jgi:hypothetical protein
VIERRKKNITAFADLTLKALRAKVVHAQHKAV